MISGMLLAAGADWLSFVVPIVFFVIYAINQLISANKGNAQQQRNQPQRNQPRRPPETERPFRPQAPAEVHGGTKSQLNTEIEQFLKRASERRGERPRREAIAAKPTPKPPKPPREPLREQPHDVLPIEPRELGSVAASVEKHMGNRGFSQRAEHLADDIVRADAQMEEHLQKSFNRRVGTLGDSAPGGQGSPVTDVKPIVEVDPASAAAGIGMLLANAQSLRHAIILNEILERPEHRW